MQNLKVWNWKNERLSEGGRDRYCYRQCCGMCGGVFVVCKVFGRRRNLNTAELLFEAAGPSYSLSSVLALLPLKGPLPHSDTLALLSSILGFLLSLLVKLTLTLRPTHTHTHWHAIDCKGWCQPALILWFYCPPAPCVVSEVSWRVAWQCVRWTSGWDEVSEQAERFVLKEPRKPQCVDNHLLTSG